jgi:hypothetical protein
VLCTGRVTGILDVYIYGPYGSDDTEFKTNVAVYLHDWHVAGAFDVGHTQKERAFRRANGLLALRQLTRRAEPGEAARKDLW